MRIVVQLKADAARHVRASGTRGGSRHRPLAWLSHDLSPVHTRDSDTVLDTFFEIRIDDPAEGARLLDHLRRDPAVDAAYEKPADEPPSM
jgi:hypothetical protein